MLNNAMSAQLRRWRRWLQPGIGLKRWALVHALGITLIVAGAMLLRDARIPAGLLVGTGGVVLVLVGLRGLLRAIDRVLFPSGTPTLVDVLRQRRTLARGPRIVALGGGTGLSTLLRGLKHHTAQITAVVTVFDDGGSSGRLRRDLGVLPPGDIRHCLVALAEAEPLMTRLFEYRFPGGELDGHAFGNLFIASLAGVTGDLELAVKETSKVLNIRGRVLPATVSDVVLCAEYDDGSIVEGESRIPLARRPIHRVFLRPADAPALPEVLQAIADADLILIGPGSLYTSVIPTLLVRDVADAVRRARAPRVYVCNVMTQPGETDGFDAAAHIRTVMEAGGPRLLTHVLVNTRMPTNPELRARYEAQGAYPVGADTRDLAPLDLQVIARGLISEEELLRHDPTRLAAAVIDILPNAAPSRTRFDKPKLAPL